jgi:hypothetical protein
VKSYSKQQSYTHCDSYTTGIKEASEYKDIVLKLEKEVNQNTLILKWLHVMIHLLASPAQVHLLFCRPLQAGPLTSLLASQLLLHLQVAKISRLSWLAPYRFIIRLVFGNREMVQLFLYL